MISSEFNFNWTLYESVNNQQHLRTELIERERERTVVTTFFLVKLIKAVVNKNSIFKYSKLNDLFDLLTCGFLFETYLFDLLKK